MHVAPCELSERRVPTLHELPWVCDLASGDDETAEAHDSDRDAHGDGEERAPSAFAASPPTISEVAVASESLGGAVTGCFLRFLLYWSGSRPVTDGGRHRVRKGHAQPQAITRTTTHVTPTIVSMGCPGGAEGGGANGGAGGCGGGGEGAMKGRLRTLTGPID